MYKKNRVACRSGALLLVGFCSVSLSSDTQETRDQPEKVASERHIDIAAIHSIIFCCLLSAVCCVLYLLSPGLWTSYHPP